MIQTKTETNYLMNWDDPKDRINYFNNLRVFLRDIELVAISMGGLENPIKDLFKSWNVYFIDAPGDPMPRVNLDEPK